MPTVIEVDPLHRALAMLALRDLVRHEPLTAVPLLWPEAEDPGWLIVAEAGEAVTVTEISEAGAVPFLKVANGADRSVFLLDGEDLVGVAPPLPRLCGGSHRDPPGWTDGGGPRGRSWPRLAAVPTQPLRQWAWGRRSGWWAGSCSPRPWL